MMRGQAQLSLGTRLSRRALDVFVLVTCVILLLCVVGILLVESWPSAQRERRRYDFHRLTGGPWSIGDEVESRGPPVVIQPDCGH